MITSLRAAGYTEWADELVQWRCRWAGRHEQFLLATAGTRFVPGISLTAEEREALGWAYRTIVIRFTEALATELVAFNLTGRQPWRRLRKHVVRFYDPAAQARRWVRMLCILDTGVYADRWLIGDLGIAADELPNDQAALVRGLITRLEAAWGSV